MREGVLSCIEERMEGGKVAKLSYESDQGDKFEILEGSHVSVKEAKGGNFFWEWESASAVREELEQMLARGEQIFQGLMDLVKSHPFIADGD